MVVIIGEGWLIATDREGRRRLDDPADTVRVQIERALASGVTVIPVLLNRTTMPQPEHLPRCLAQLSFQNGMQLRPDPDFHKDVARLLRAIRNPPLRGTPPIRKRALIAVLARGRKGGIAGALFALVCVILCLVIKPDLHFPAALFAGWPIGWLLVWWRKRRTRAVLMACFLLPLFLVAVYFIALCSFIPVGFVCVLFIPAETISPFQNLIGASIWCVFCGGAIGAMFGGMQCAKRVESIPPANGDVSHTWRAVRRGMVLGGLLGFVFSSTLCGVVLFSSPESLALEKSFTPPSWYVVEFIGLVEAVMFLWMLFGLAVLVLGDSDRNSGF
jgi:hypothetical protein